MLIPCPLCGEREHGEFTYLGDARLRQRPDPDAPDAAARFHDYVHLRENPPGRHRELWYHEAGCRSWLIVTRDTVTHAVERAVRAGDAGDGEPA